MIGWGAAVILFATVSRQVWTQWRVGTAVGVSRWLFIGQMAASAGFIVYSWLLSNWVFVFTNLLMLCTAGFGQWCYVRAQEKDRSAERQK
jgi:hypothetical protein